MDSRIQRSTRTPNPTTISRNLKGLPALTPDKILACELICAKRGKFPSYDEIAAQVGVSPRTLHRWRMEADFNEYVRQRTLLDANLILPQLFDSLMERAINGSAKHAELLLKSLSMLTTDNNHIVNVQPLIDDRSTEAIEQEVEALKRELGLVDDEESEGK